MDGLLGPLTLFLGGKCFLYVVLAENVDFARKIQNPIFLSLSEKHVFVASSLKWTVKRVISASLFAYRNANKELRSRICSLPPSCLCLLCLRNGASAERLYKSAILWTMFPNRSFSYC